jgi:hypothetical protein
MLRRTFLLGLMILLLAGVCWADGDSLIFYPYSDTGSWLWDGTVADINEEYPPDDDDSIWTSSNLYPALWYPLVTAGDTLVGALDSVRLNFRADASASANVDLGLFYYESDPGLWLLFNGEANLTVTTSTVTYSIVLTQFGTNPCIWLYFFFPAVYPWGVKTGSNIHGRQIRCNWMQLVCYYTSAVEPPSGQVIGPF